MPVRNTPRRATATDVARASNVSQATVSYVMNNTPGQTISQQTRERVLEAASRLGYVPNASAQILAGGQSRFVVLAMGDLPLGELVARFERTSVDDLRQHGFIPVIDQTVGRDDHGPLLALAATLRPAAVITLAPFSEPELAQLRHNGDPRVLTVFPTPDALLQSVADTGAAQAAHLAERGHRSVAFARSEDPLLRALVDARSRGVKAECERREMGLAGSLHWNDDLTDLVAQLRRMTGTHPDVTAVAAYNDHVALAVCAAARALDLDVPSRLAVVGADDLQMGTLVSPTLSSARYDLAGTVASSFGQLLTSGRPAGPPTELEVEITIVQREST